MANFKLKEGASKTSTGISLSGLSIIPQTGFIMPFAGPTPITTATGTSGTNTITVASAAGAFVGQGIYGTGLNSPAPGLNYITAVSGTTLTVANPLTTTISGASVRLCPVGWLLCDGNNGTVDLRGYFLRGASSAATIGAITGSNVHAHSYFFSAITHGTATNAHQAPEYYTNLNAGGADASHTHIINVAVNTPSHYSGNFINWSNGNNTNRTFRSHDHVGNINYNSAAAAEGNHTHPNSATLGTINHTVSETAHGHNIAASPSGGSPNVANPEPANILMHYIVKV
jgi:hypothetical protein